MELITSTVYLVCTILSINSYNKSEKIIKNAIHSYKDGYGFDTREGYPY